MIRKICPICDQTMKSAHYCRNCRTWIRTPIVRDVDYYLNERHPSWEAGCSYHTMPEQPSRPAAASAQPNSTGAAPAQSNRPPVLPTTRRPSSQKTAGKSLPGLEAAVIVVLIILFKVYTQVGAPLIEQAAKLIQGNKAPDAYDVDLGSYMDLDDYQELTDEEVRAAGVVCNSADHFPVSGEALVSALVRLLEQQGLEICGTNTYSYNELYDDGTTWYDTWTSIDLQDGEMGTYQYVEVDYDTATGELHQVSLSLEDGPVLVNTAAEVVTFIGEHGGPAGVTQYTDQLREELAAAMQQEEGYQLDCEGLYLEGVSYDTNYNVVVVPMTQ